MPKARTPSTWVTVLASQPSVSMETETTQRIEPPSWPGLPTVFMTSRSSSWSVMFSACAAIAGALDDLAAEALDLVGGHAAEVVVERIAGFELLAVDEQRVRPRQRVAVSRRSCGRARGGRSPASSCRPRSRGGSRR